MNGVDDARLSAAAADVALQELDDFGGTGIRITLQQAEAAHDHARRAVGALESTCVDESLLHGMQTTVLLQSFDCGDWLADRRADGNLAGADRCRSRPALLRSHICCR